MCQLVSIIVPTYNRAHLIGETLDSIICQTYINWECIVVDDGSNDNTAQLMSKYCKKDSRIHYYMRPENKQQGANSCRNYGFELSKGDYIKWFDSDDIMVPQHLSILMEILQIKNVDFVVSDSINFEVGKVVNSKAYDFDKINAVMDPLKYAVNEIGWITDDFFGKRAILTNLRYNEQLEDGQEYNFFIKILLLNTNGVFIDDVLTKMRIHSQSLGVINRLDYLNHIRISAKIKILTLEDVFKYNHKLLNDWFLSGYTNISFTLVLSRKLPPELLKGFLYIVKIKKLPKGLFFLLSLITGWLFKKGYSLNKYARS
jgi:glycosyltransferase involved in cell wall biosynthesis